MDLSTEEQAVIATVREFVDREVRPVVRDLEHADTYPNAAEKYDAGLRCDMEAGTAVRVRGGAARHGRVPAQRHRRAVGGARRAGLSGLP